MEMNVRAGGPAEVKGSLQRIRDVLHPVLLLIFLLTPWFRWNHEPVFLIDIIKRHFIIFGVQFYSHETPLLFYFLILLLLSIFLITAIWGRVWCGWACPQTVFLHGVFNKVESWVMGPYAKRVVAYRDSATKTKVKIAFLHVLYLGICWVLAHSFSAYFLSSDVIMRFIAEGPSRHLSTFIVLTLISGVLYLNFVFFRERLCFFVCPYGRFQNALIDANSVVVFYDPIRGEPRGKAFKSSDTGDCVDCKRCLTVCPTKIDIRNGFQLECISCAKCIDACNDVMTKLKRPEGLIRYQTGNNKSINFKRFRIALYLLLMLIFIAAFALSLAKRSKVDFSLIRAQPNPFSVRIEQNQKVLQNQFKVHIQNQTHQTTKFNLTLSEKNLASGFRLLSPIVDIELAAEQDLKLPVFIEIEDEKFVFSDSDVEFTLKSESETTIKNFKFIKGN